MDNILWAQRFIEDAFNSGDPKVIKLFMVEHSILPLGTILLYLLTSALLGPYFMKNRRAFNLKSVMFVYDATIVIMNVTIFVRVVLIANAAGILALCKEDAEVPDEDIKREVRNIVWTMYISKFIDMIDTIFLVLRKQSERISKLHLYHHSTVPLLFWFAMRSDKQPHLMVYGAVNAVIHSVMYFYYALCSLGPRYRPLLKYKQYITLFQIIQFLLMFPYFGFVITSGCAKNKAPVTLFSLHTALLLYLFLEYYIRTYWNVAKKKPYEKNGTTHITINGLNLRDTIDIYKRE